MKITKEELSWALYDFANSAFATVVMAGFFPIFFKSLFITKSTQLSTFYLGLGSSIASIIIAISFPFLGTFSDIKNNKKGLLSIFALAGILFTSLLFIINQNWFFALIFYIIAYIGFAGANVFYDSLLNKVSIPDRRDFISSLGYSLGYLGGGLLFLLTIIIYQNPSIFKIENESIALKISFLLVGIWWLIFSIPLFLFIKEKKETKKDSFISMIKNPINKKIILFLIAYWCYIDGVDTIIKMSIDYGISIGLSSKMLILALLMVQFLGFPFAILYSLFARLISAKNAIILAIIGYTCITIFAVFMNNSLHFFILAFFVSIFQGGIQALSRSYFSNMINESESGKLFGLYNMVGKFATIVGPFLVGITTFITKNHRTGISSIIILFIAGLILFTLSSMEKKNA
ncbi:MAG: MFS transporter [Brevinematales bacterium]|nr:MFS transporter [Brevinematales bacterium]